MAVFNEMCALTSRKYVVEKGMNVPKFSGKHNLLRSHSSVLALHDNLQIFEDCFSLKTRLVTTVSETCVLTSSKYVAEDTNSNPKQSKPYV